MPKNNLGAYMPKKYSGAKKRKGKKRKGRKPNLRRAVKRR